MIRVWKFCELIQNVLG